MAAVGDHGRVRRAPNRRSAQFLMKEALAGGPQALDARDKGLRSRRRRSSRSLKKTRRERQLIPGSAVAAVLGAIHRLLASRLRRSERALADVQHDLDLWVESYARAARTAPLGRAESTARHRPARHISRRRLTPAGPCSSPGRPRLSRAEIVENHRQRIMFATAQVVQEHGYTRATVSDITGRASVDGRGFYRIFADKQEAFSAIHELGFQYLMAVTARAFFAGNDWPERIWEAFRAATQSIDDTPTLCARRLRRGLCGWSAWDPARR